LGACADQESERQSGASSQADSISMAIEQSVATAVDSLEEGGTAGNQLPSPAPISLPQPEGRVTVVGTEGPSLTFSNGERFTTNLYGMEYIGLLPTESRLPGYLILSGKPCTECDAQVGIYLHHPADGAMPDEASLRRMPYPGVERHYETGEIVSETRFFFGEVPQIGAAALWFMKVKDMQDGWQNAKYMLHTTADTLSFSDGEAVPTLKTAEGLSETGELIELPGFEYFSEP